MKDLSRVRPSTEQEILPRPEILTAGLHQKQALMHQVGQMARRGEIGSTYDLRQVNGIWAVKVVRIAERPSWWSRNWLKASLGAVGGLGFLGVTVLVLRLLAVALAAVLPLLAGAAILLAVVAVLASVSGGDSISVTQIVKIKR